MLIVLLTVVFSKLIFLEIRSSWISSLGTRKSYVKFPHSLHKVGIQTLTDINTVFIFHFKPWAPTFLSMDVDGRVIRADSFSKVLSSG